MSICHIDYISPSSIYLQKKLKKFHYNMFSINLAILPILDKFSGESCLWNGNLLTSQLKARCLRQDLISNPGLRRICLCLLLLPSNSIYRGAQILKWDLPDLFSLDQVRFLDPVVIDWAGSNWLVRGLDGSHPTFQGTWLGNSSVPVTWQSSLFIAIFLEAQNIRVGCSGVSVGCKIIN